MFWQSKREKNEIWSFPYQQIMPSSEPCATVDGRTVLLKHTTMMTNIWRKFLHQEDFSVVSTVNFDTSVDEMNAGCLES